MKLNQLSEAKYHITPLQQFANMITDIIMQADSDDETVEEYIDTARWYITEQFTAEVMPLIEEELERRLKR